MCLSGRLYGAAEASAAGLVDRLVPHDTLVDSALDLAKEIASNADRQLQMTKALLSANGCDSDTVAVQLRETAELRKCWKSPEHAEAVKAFLEKRPAKFR
jgi:enoyl-CoA hydratase/carnithine racemase